MKGPLCEGVEGGWMRRPSADERGDDAGCEARFLNLKSVAVWRVIWAIAVPLLEAKLLWKTARRAGSYGDRRIERFVSPLALRTEMQHLSVRRMFARF